MAIPPEQLQHFKATVLGAKRPLIFYDDDADGLCSYLLCLRARGGEGIGARAQHTVPLEMGLRKIEENAPDLVVILDCATVDTQFLDRCPVPILWLDHHEPQKAKHAQLTYLNPRLSDDTDNRSTTHWVWHALGREEDLWIAGIGSISDWQLTDVAHAFWNKYPDILQPVETPPQAMFGAHPFAELLRIVQFNLKGDSTDVRTSTKIFTRIESPHELLQHSTPRAKLLYKRYQIVDKEYQKLLRQARAGVVEGSKVLYALFSQVEISLLSEVSNCMLYEHPDKLIFLARAHNGDVKLSLRGEHWDIAAAVKAAMQEGIRGNAGGHMHACGGNIKGEDFPRFKALVLNNLGINE